MNSKPGVQQDQITDMLLFMDNLPPEFDHSTLNFSDDNNNQCRLQNPNHDPFSSSTGTTASSMDGMREMIFRIAAMQPIDIDPESVKPKRRKNVKISRDPQSVAARHRRERISHRMRILQRLVPGGTKMDTASMLDEAIHYVKFLKSQVQTMERAAVNRHQPMPENGGSCFPVMKGSSLMHSSSSYHGGFEQQQCYYDPYMDV